MDLNAELEKEGAEEVDELLTFDMISNKLEEVDKKSRGGARNFLNYNLALQSIASILAKRSGEDFIHMRIDSKSMKSISNETKTIYRDINAHYCDVLKGKLIPHAVLSQSRDTTRLRIMGLFCKQTTTVVSMLFLLKLYERHVVTVDPIAMEKIFESKLVECLKKKFPDSFNRILVFPTSALVELYNAFLDTPKGNNAVLHVGTKRPATEGIVTNPPNTKRLRSSTQIRTEINEKESERVRLSTQMAQKQTCMAEKKSQSLQIEKELTVLHEDYQVAKSRERSILLTEELLGGGPNSFDKFIRVITVMHKTFHEAGNYDERAFDDTLILKVKMSLDNERNPYSNEPQQETSDLVIDESKKAGGEIANNSEADAY